MASVSEIAPLSTEFELPQKKGTRGPDKGPRVPGGFKKAVEEIANVIFSKTRISVEGAAKAVIPSIPKMLTEIADDIRTGSVDKFKFSLEKLEEIIGKLGIDLKKYNKDLAKFLKDRDANIIQSEQKIIEIREKGAKAEINEITGKINVLSREEIKERTDTLRQVLRDTKRIKREKDKEEKLLQQSRLLSETEIEQKKEFVSESYETLQRLETQKQTLMGTLNIDNEEDLPGTGPFGFGRSRGRSNRGGGEGIREYTPDFIMNIFDEFKSQIMMFIEPFIIMKDVVFQLLKPLKLLGKLFKPLLDGMGKLIKSIGRQILVGMMLVATNLLRILTDKKVLIGMAALGAILGLKKLHDKFKQGDDGPTPGTAGDMAGEAAMSNAAGDENLTDEELHKKYDNPYSIFRKRKIESRDSETLKKMSGDNVYSLDDRLEGNKTINQNGSMDSKNTNSVIVKNDSALNQKSENNYNSMINAGSTFNAFVDNVEGV